MNKYIGISQPLKIVIGRHANIDARYGPYNSISEANLSVPEEIRSIGLTVGILSIENSVRTVKEYWWKTSIGDTDLVLKTAEAGTGSSAPIIPIIGDNGNWYINGQDTGKTAKGEPGLNGVTPVKGVDYKDGERGDPFRIDEQGSLSGRNTFNNRSKGFTYLDTQNKNLYIKNSDTFGDWSLPVPFGRGEDGITPEIGSNGNWFVGNVDTGIKAKGSDLKWEDLTSENKAELKGEPGEDGKSFTVNEQGNLISRDTYDNEEQGFSYLDTENGLLYFKNSVANKDWSNPIPFGKGEDGDKGDKGDKGERGEDGPTPVFREKDGWIQYSLNGTTWVNIYEIDPEETPIEEPVNPARTQFINDNSVGLGRNLVKDPKFRKHANWNIVSYSATYRKEGKLYIPSSKWNDQGYYAPQVLNTIIGQTYHVKIDIETQNVIHLAGQTGGYHLTFSNTTYDPMSIVVTGTTPKTTYTSSFVANGTTTVMRLTKTNTDMAPGTVGMGIFSNPIVSTSPSFTGSIYNSLDEVINEAKHLYPLNFDYELPEALPARTYTPSTNLNIIGQNNLVIEGFEFPSNADVETYTAVRLFGSQNITIRNCKFKDINLGKSISAEECTNITVEFCEFENVHRGFIVQNCIDGGIVFKNNHVKNLLGELRGGSKFSQAVQLNGVAGPGNKIVDNSIDNILYESGTEDVINTFQASGTVESPLTITGNWLRGGGPVDPSEIEHTGGAITMGDWGGQHILCEDNIMIDTGSAGPGVGGGNYITIRNNKIYGTQRFYGRSAIIAYNWTPTETGETTNLVILNNPNNWRHKDYYYSVLDISGPLRSVVTNWETTAAPFDSDIDERILPPNLFVRFPYEGAIVEPKLTKAYVDEKVKTPVPIGALFTDTMTTINGKTGVITKADIEALGFTGNNGEPSNGTELTLGNYRIFFNAPDNSLDIELI